MENFSAPSDDFPRKCTQAARQLTLLASADPVEAGEVAMSYFRAYCLLMSTQATQEEFDYFINRVMENCRREFIQSKADWIAQGHGRS